MMPITTSCPGCKSLFRLPDDLAGEEVRCQKCARVFVVPMPITGTTEPSVVAPEAPTEAPPEDAPSEAAPAPQTPVEAVVMATLTAPTEEIRRLFQRLSAGRPGKRRKYRIEMMLGDSPTALTLLDPENIEGKSVAGKKTASLAFVAVHDGTYCIRVFAPLRKDRAAYTLRITTEP